MSDCFYKTSVSLTIENYPGFCQEKNNIYNVAKRKDAVFTIVSPFVTFCEFVDKYWCLNYHLNIGLDFG